MELSSKNDKLISNQLFLPFRSKKSFDTDICNMDDISEIITTLITLAENFNYSCINTIINNFALFFEDLPSPIISFENVHLIFQYLSHFFSNINTLSLPSHLNLLSALSYHYSSEILDFFQPEFFEFLFSILEQYNPSNESTILPIINIASNILKMNPEVGFLSFPKIIEIFSSLSLENVEILAACLIYFTNIIETENFEIISHILNNISFFFQLLELQNEFMSSKLSNFFNLLCIYINKNNNESYLMTFDSLNIEQMLLADNPIILKSNLNILTNFIKFNFLSYDKINYSIFLNILQNPRETFIQEYLDCFFLILYGIKSSENQVGTILPSFITEYQYLLFLFFQSLEDQSYQVKVRGCKCFFSYLSLLSTDQLNLLSNTPQFLRNFQFFIQLLSSIKDDIEIVIRCIIEIIQNLSGVSISEQISLIIEQILEDSHLDDLIDPQLYTYFLSILD